jgi:hypothetical protein
LQHVLPVDFFQMIDLRNVNWGGMNDKNDLLEYVPWEFCVWICVRK